MCVCLSSESRVSGQHHLDERVRNFLTLSSLHSEELQEQQLKKYEKEEVALEISCTRLSLLLPLLHVLILHQTLHVEAKPASENCQLFIMLWSQLEMHLDVIQKLCLICYKFFSCHFWSMSWFFENKRANNWKTFSDALLNNSHKNMLATCHFPIQNLTKKTDSPL